MQEAVDLHGKTCGVTGLEVRQRVGGEVVRDGGQPCACHRNVVLDVLEQLGWEQQLAIAVRDDRDDADRGRTDLLHRIRPWDEAAKDNAISNPKLLRELDERGLVLAVSEHAKLEVGPVTPEQGERSDRHLHAVALDQRAVRDDESRSCLTVLRVSRRGRDRGRVR